MLALMSALSDARLIFLTHQQDRRTLQLQNNDFSESFVEFIALSHKPPARTFKLDLPPGSRPERHRGSCHPCGAWPYRDHHSTATLRKYGECGLRLLLEETNVAASLPVHLPDDISRYVARSDRRGQIIRSALPPASPGYARDR